mgnify:CR=1 FL=1
MTDRATLRAVAGLKPETLRETIETGLDLQSQMLFHSVIPEEKFPKEQGIVLGELAQSRDRGDRFFDETLRQVRLIRPFYMGLMEVTNGQLLIEFIRIVEFPCIAAIAVDAGLSPRRRGAPR